MNKKLLVTILLFSLMNTQCKKETKNEIDLSAITQTDALGNLTGQPDNTDWTKDNTWTSAEIKLFETPASSQLANTETATISVAPAFPNPINSVFMLYFNTSAVTLLQIVITDKYLTVKDRHYFLTQTGVNSLQLKLDEMQYANNATYRVYYGFYSLAGGQYFKGHGDVKVSR